MTDTAVIALLAGVVVTSVFTWVRAAIATRRAEGDKAETRARWEGRVTAQLETVSEQIRSVSATIDRIETRLAALPCSQCPDVRRDTG